MLIFLFISVFIIGLYAFVLVVLLLSVQRSKLVNTSEWSTKVSVLIAARNEEKYIERCLRSVLSQRYPSHLLEVIVIDDCSEDATSQLAQRVLQTSSIAHQVLSLNETGKTGKKAALEYGISKASGELIICTDADSFALNQNWVSAYINTYIAKGAKLIAGPVLYTKTKGFLVAFQQIELLILNLVSAGTFKLKKPVMCNGANMAFARKVFIEVGGYEGNLHLASGDDVFLLNKVSAKYPDALTYLFSKESLVYTAPADNINTFIQQRIRWAGKFKHNSNFFNAFIGLVSFAANVWLVLLIALSLFFPQWSNYFILLLAGKCLIDFLLLFLGTIFFRQKQVLIWFPLATIIYPFYVCLAVVAGVFIRTQWKGRKI